MSKIVTIYCEGKKGSHDYDVLEKTFDGLPAGWQLKPLGSVRGARPIIAFQNENSVVKSDSYLFFRDRDFDDPVPPQEELTVDGYVYSSYKTTIENYLINLDTFLSFLQSHPFKLTENWNPQQITNRFLDAMKSIKYHQAMRHALGRMGEAYRDNTSDLYFGTNTNKNRSGTLPDNLLSSACLESGKEQLRKSKAVTDQWTEERFTELYNNFAAQSDDAFFTQHQYVNWFQGKDMMKAISKHFTGFPKKHYYGYAKKQFDYTQFQDLVQLRKIVEQELK